MACIVTNLQSGSVVLIISMFLSFTNKSFAFWVNHELCRNCLWKKGKTLKTLWWSLSSRTCWYMDFTHTQVAFITWCSNQPSIFLWYHVFGTGKQQIVNGLWLQMEVNHCLFKDLLVLFWLLQTVCNLSTNLCTHAAGKTIWETDQ